MEQLFFVLIVGAIALVKWLASGDGESRGTDPTKHTTSAFGPKRRPAEDSEEERMRKFMEALGVPTGSALPKRLPQPPQTRAEVIERQQNPRPKKLVREAKQRRLPPAPTSEVAPVPQPAAEFPPASAPAFVQPPVLAESPAVPTPCTDIRAAFRTGANLRDAIVLREILGPPRGLQSFP